MALLKNNNDERSEVETLWKRMPPERGAGATASSPRRPFAGLPGLECVHVNRSLGANDEPGNEQGARGVAAIGPAATTMASAAVSSCDAWALGIVSSPVSLL